MRSQGGGRSHCGALATDDNAASVRARARQADGTLKTRPSGPPGGAGGGFSPPPAPPGGGGITAAGAELPGCPARTPPRTGRSGGRPPRRP
ncbi:hypothetical protein FFZ77_16065 [Streptomyces katsurahamanus]|uniref:Uncharacterized protein n=1 Tax=Streptomyces katsurahamanus TaxID=2577098 RepID=A0ABW9NUV0_9ACTN|nr:hypothetical protein [Streptomyces katsurahamanus]